MARMRRRLDGKADFLHIETIGGKPTLSVIHVKAAGDESAGRGLSVSDYEIVTGQAVKNLRWVDRSALGDDLAKTLNSRIKEKV
jgi:hypothetical protein